MANVILVAVDFDEGSLDALETAKQLGRELSAELVLLHVYRAPFYVYPDLDPTLAQDLRAEIGAAAKRSLDQLAASAGAPRRILREGDPTEQILAAIDELKPLMVVMGTHGRRGLARVFMGSVAERVVRRSPVPVMTVRPGPAAERE